MFFAWDCTLGCAVFTGNSKIEEVVEVVTYSVLPSKHLILRAMEQVAQSGCGVSSYGHIQDLSGRLPMQHIVGYLLWRRNCTQ